MDREQLLQKAENIRANPPAFFQVAGLHELDEVTTVEDHFIKEGKTDTIHFYIIRPASEKKPLPFVVNIHGGGMIRCHGDRDILFARRLAYASDCAVVSIDYHLAPQYFYPYQIDETEILINHLLQNAAQYHLRQNYILSGQSSGGNIACAVTLRSIQKRQLQKPALLLLAYSWLDLHTDPNDKPDDCPDERKEQYRFYKDCYLCDVDDNIAEVSPALSPSNVFREFPETLMIEGGLDELREENLRLFMTLCDAGTTVQMQFFPESMHGFMVNQKADWKKAQKVIQQKVSEVFSEKL